MSDFEHAEMMADLASTIEEDVEKEGILNVKEILTGKLADLRKFRDMRKEMAAKRKALARAIKILDKRVEMTLDDIKVLQMTELD